MFYSLLRRRRREPCLEAPPRVRSFHLVYKTSVAGVPSDAKAVEVWIPVPHDDAYQQIRDLRIESPVAYEMKTAPDGNQMVHIAAFPASAANMTVTMEFDATRQEHRQSRLFDHSQLEREESAAELARYLQPDRLVPIDKKIKTWAQEVVTAANAKTDLEMARAIYNHIVATVKYDKTGKGWGRGDIYYACESRRGNCTDFHAIFIGYSRALGIPARFAIGLPVPVGKPEGKIAGYHCWAEFYAKGIGWVPVDASEAAKDPTRREYFFGAHDENRIEFSKGRDIILAPRQHGEPLNYFIYPYVEVDGRAFSGASQELAYADMGSAGRESDTKTLLTLPWDAERI